MLPQAVRRFDVGLLNWEQRGRTLAMAITVGIVIGMAASALSIWPEMVNQAGEDYRWFMAQTSRWLETGVFYLPRQLAGPYEAVTAVDVLYPPVVLWLFVPFTALPAALWWAVPLGICAAHVIAARPRWWSWPIIAILCWIPRDQSIVLWGNTGMWVAAAVALGLRFAWASPFVMFKPTFAPFALIGIRHRGWWLGMAALCGMSLLLLPMWPDYVTAMRNNVGPWPGLLYSVPDYLFAAIPLVAWAARSTEE